MATKNPRAVFFTLLFLFLLLGGGIAFLVWMQRVPGPTARFAELPTAIGASTELELEVEATRGGVRALRVEVEQGGNRHELAREQFEDAAARRSIRVAIDAKDAGLSEAEAVLLVFAEDGFKRPRSITGEPVLRLGVMVDLTPPALSVASVTRYPEQGGAGIAVLREGGDGAQILTFAWDGRRFRLDGLRHAVRVRAPETARRYLSELLRQREL